MVRDRDETETFGNYVSRPSRDRDVETETTSLLMIILISPRIPVFRCDTGTTYILDKCGVHSDCNAPDTNKTYEFKEIFC